MNNELNRHKKSDAIKWVIVFVLIAALTVCAGAALALAVADRNKENEPQEETEVQKVYENDFTAECFGSPNVRLAAVSSSTMSSDNSVSKTLKATVYPTTASNKLVDWDIAWSSHSKTEEVTDYVTVTPTYDGSTEATVTCHQAFGSDQIIITVTTRQGGYTATCIVSFRGVASSMYLTSTLSPVSNEGRGEYYDLPSKNSVVFTANLSNVWDSVGSYNLSAQISATGSLYFCDTFSGSYNSEYSNVRQCDISEYIDDLGITASVSGNIITVKTNKALDDSFYSREEADEFGAGNYYYDDLVWYEDWYEDLGIVCSEEYKNGGKYNASHIDSCYFTLKVTDSVSGLSTSVKFWISTGATSVELNENEISF